MTVQLAETQVDLLFELKRGPKTSRQLADDSLRSHESVGHTMRNLENKNIVRRTYRIANDKDVIHWELTDLGRKQLP